MRKGLLLLFSAMLITGGIVFAGIDAEEIDSNGAADTCTPQNCPGSGANCCKNSAGSWIFKGKDQ